MSQVTDILDAIILKAFKEGHLEIEYPEKRFAISAKFKLYNRKKQIAAQQLKSGNIPELAEASEGISLTISPERAATLILYAGASSTDMQVMASLLGDQLGELLASNSLSNSEEALKKMLLEELEEEPLEAAPTPYFTRD